MEHTLVSFLVLASHYVTYWKQKTDIVSQLSRRPIDPMTIKRASTMNYIIYATVYIRIYYFVGSPDFSPYFFIYLSTYAEVSVSEVLIGFSWRVFVR